jgi:hypothetical protein
MNTITKYTEAGNGENSTVDGRVFAYNNSGTTFSNLRSGTSVSFSSQPTATVSYLCELASYSTTNNFTRLARGFLTFDTSEIGLNATILSASINLYPTSKRAIFGDTSIEIVESFQTTDNYIDNSTYSQIGSVSFASMLISNISTNAYNTFNLNSAGIASINKTGISKFAVILGYDLNGSFSGTWVASNYAGIYTRQAEYGSLDYTPFLNVTYEINSVIVNKFQMMM